MALPAALAACGSLQDGEPSPPIDAKEIEALRARYEGEEFEFPLVNREAFAEHLLPADVSSPFDVVPGTVIVNTEHKHLYFQQPNGMARRYGVAVGNEGYEWKGSAIVGRLERWPDWFPTERMRREGGLPARIPGGPRNPLGARAIYLYQDGVDTLYRIHGTPEPWTIGTSVSSGCIRMVNEDVIELYERVLVGSPVLVLQ